MKNDIRGSVTVLVTTLLLPSVIIIGSMYDLCIHTFSSSLATMHGNLAMASVMSEYNRELKDSYGIFGIEKDLEEMQTSFEGYYEDSIAVALNDGEYAFPVIHKDSSSVQVTSIGVFKEIPQSFINQIANFYKYYGVNSLFGNLSDLLSSGDIAKALEEAEGIFDILDNKETEDNDNDAMKKYSKYTEALAELGALYREFYYRATGSDSFLKQNIINIITTANDNQYEMIELQDEYEEYKELLAQALLDLENNRDEVDEIYDILETLSDEFNVIASEVSELLDKHFESTIRDIFVTDFPTIPQSAFDEIGDSFEVVIHYDNLEQLELLTVKIKKKHDELMKCEADLLVALEKDVNEKLKESLLAQLEEAKKINIEADDIPEIANIIDLNKNAIDSYTYTLAHVLYGITEYSLVTINSAIPEYVELEVPDEEWLYFKNDSSIKSFLDNIKKNIIDYEDDSDMDKKTISNLLKNNTSDDTDRESKYLGRDYNDISDSVWNLLKQEESSASYSIPESGDDDIDFDDLLPSSADNSYLSSMSTKMINKILMCTYSVDMFSSQTTGLTYGSNERETKTSTTGIDMTKDFNFFYTAEQEFLFAGNRNPVVNQLAVETAIFAVKVVPNTIFTFTNDNLNTEINIVAMSLSAACPFLAPYSSIIVRTAVVLLETFDDIAVLTQGGGVEFIRTEKNWKFMLGDGSAIYEAIENGGSAIEDDGEKKDKGNLKYEHYLATIMFLFTDDLTIANRLQFLMTVNLTNDGTNKIEEPKYNVYEHATQISGIAKFDQKSLFNFYQAENLGKYSFTRTY